MKFSRAAGMTMKVNKDYCKIVHANDEESVAEITVSDVGVYIPVATDVCRRVSPTQLKTTKCFPVVSRHSVMSGCLLWFLTVHSYRLPKHESNAGVTCVH